MVNMKALGDRGELLVAQELIERNWNVSFPFGDNARYDIIAEKDRHFCRIQVKSTENVTMTPRHGPHYAFGLCHGKAVKDPYDKNSIDFFICCAIERKRFWVLPIEKVTFKTLKIFITGKKHHEYEGAWDLLQ
jgi:uncharacterized protein YqfB (UPF0267 family)